MQSNRAGRIPVNINLLNMNKKDQRRERAAERLRMQLEAGSKPRRSNTAHWASSRKWRTLYATDPLAEKDIARIQRELERLK